MDWPPFKPVHDGGKGPLFYNITLRQFTLNDSHQATFEGMKTFIEVLQSTIFIPIFHLPLQSEHLAKPLTRLQPTYLAI